MFLLGAVKTDSVCYEEGMVPCDSLQLGRQFLGSIMTKVSLIERLEKTIYNEFVASLPIYKTTNMKV